MGRMLLRSLQISGLLAVMLPASAQDLDRKISFSMPASRASVLLPALGREAGLNLTASPRTSDEVLIVNVHDVPLRDLLGKIASVTQAEWKSMDGGYQLNRSSSLQTQAERADLDMRSKLLADKLRQAGIQVSKLPAFDAAEAQRQAAKIEKQNEAMTKAYTGQLSGGVRKATSGGAPEDGPSVRALVPILQIIGPDVLAGLADGRRVVFSTNANRSQISLPGRATSLIRDFVKQTQMLSTASQAQKSDDTRNIRVFSANSAQTGPGNPDLGLGKALVIIKRTGSDLRCSLLVADPNGKMISTGGYSLSVPAFTVTPEEEAARNAASAQGAKIPLSSLGTEFANVMKVLNPPSSGVAVRGTLMMLSAGKNSMSISLGNSAEKPVDISPALRDRLLQPEKFDPQSLAVSEGLNAAALAKHENLVAAVPDEAIVPLTRALADGVTVETFLHKTCLSTGVRITEGEGWMVAESRTPALAREKRIERAALGKLLRTLNSQLCARLSDICDFALAQNKTVSGQEYDGLTMRMINAVGTSQATALFNNPEVLRLYGTLTPVQRGVLESGGAIPIANLTPNQVSHLANEALQSNEGVDSMLPQQGFKFGPVLDLAGERTELLPGGISNAGAFRMKIERQNAAMGVDTDGFAAIYNPDELASRLYSSQNESFKVLGNSSKIDKYKPGEQIKLTLHFDLPQLAQMDRTLTDTWVDSKQVAVAYEGLPEQLRTQVDQALKLMQTTVGKIQFVRAVGVQNNIPPTP